MKFLLEMVFMVGPFFNPPPPKAGSLSGEGK
jgi:hypothetical protein